MSLLGYGLAGALQGAGSGLAKQANANKAAALEMLRRSLADNSVPIARANRTPAPQHPRVLRTESTGHESGVSSVPVPTPKPTGEMHEISRAESQGVEGTLLDHHAGATTAAGRTADQNMEKIRAGQLTNEPINTGVRPGATPDGYVKIPNPDFAGRIALAEDAIIQLGVIEKAARDGAMTGPVDFIEGSWLGRGEAGRLNRELKAGVDALSRLLTSTGASVASAEQELEMYLPSARDDSESLADKVSQLRRRLMSVHAATTRGRGANPSEPGERIDKTLELFKMTSLSDMRQAYPQYEDLSDRQIADALHKKNYIKLPVDEYYSRLGLGPVPEIQPLEGYGPGTLQLLLESHQNEQYAASQETAPFVRNLEGKFLRTPIGVATETEFGMVVVDPKTGDWQQVDPKTSVVLFDLGTGNYVAFWRNEETDENRLTSVARLILPGLATSLLSVPRAVVQSTPKLLSRTARNAQSMDRTGITPNLINSGSWGIRELGKYLATIPVLGKPAARAVQQNIDQFGQAVTKTAKKAGPITSRSDAGTATMSGIDDAMNAGRATLERKYAALGIPEAARATRSQFKRAWAQVTSKTGNPGADELQPGAQLVEGADSFGTLRQLRTQLSELTPSQASSVGLQPADIKRLRDALTNDLVAIARQHGKADDLIALDRQVARFSVETRAPLQATRDLGDAMKSAIAAPESVFDDILKMAGNGAGANEKRLATIFREIGPQARGKLAAEMISRMGKAGADAQDAAGSVFSASKFLSEWHSLSPRAREIMFSGKPGLKSALDDLVVAAERIKGIETPANPSNFVKGIVAIPGIGAVALGEPFTAVLSTAPPYVAAHILSSPKTVRWLSGFGRAQSAALRAGRKTTGTNQISKRHSRQLLARVGQLNLMAKKDVGAQLLLEHLVEKDPDPAAATEEKQTGE